MQHICVVSFVACVYREGEKEKGGRRGKEKGRGGEKVGEIPERGRERERGTQRDVDACHIT